jgi:hypothetical protein
MTHDVAEPTFMNKPGRTPPRPLAALLHKTFSDTFRKQGFASTELITRWQEIAGHEIAAHSEPDKITWQRTPEGETPEPGVLWLRVEGPTGIEIQHLSRVILERVNRFFGWRAVGDLRLRQVPLARRVERKAPTGPDPQAMAALAATMPEVTDEKLRAALARLGAAIKTG